MLLGKVKIIHLEIFEIRYQSMSLNLPADDSRCLSVREGQMEFLARFLKQRPLR